MPLPLQHGQGGPGAGLLTLGRAPRIHPSWLHGTCIQAPLQQHGGLLAKRCPGLCLSNFSGDESPASLAIRHCHLLVNWNSGAATCIGTGTGTGTGAGAGAGTGTPPFPMALLPPVTPSRTMPCVLTAHRSALVMSPDRYGSDLHNVGHPKRRKGRMRGRANMRRAMCKNRPGR